MMRVSIIGATGYVGAELLRILSAHPQAEIVHITSESHAGEDLAAIYPHLRGHSPLRLESMGAVADIAADSEVLFVALPHGHAMKLGKAVAHLPLRIIDLGADYRFADPAVYAQWYGLPHEHGDAARVYGLAEWQREAIRTAKIIGNAGCYPTASILALMPLLRAGLVQAGSIIIDAASGVSGAGRAATAANHFPELYDNFKAYGVAGHRHTPEIEQALSQLSGETQMISFTPHLLPMVRGIFATCYATLHPGVDAKAVDDAFSACYAGEPFIRLLGRNGYPTTKAVRGANFCDIGWHLDPRTGRIIVLSAIDNLVKGAAGQAVQNFNIACGFAEDTGLGQLPLYP